MEKSLYSSVKRNEKIIGTTASIVSILMALSLVEVLISNLSGSSKIFIQPLTVAGNGFIWCLYGYSRKDLFIIIPNILALFLGIITAASILL